MTLSDSVSLARHNVDSFHVFKIIKDTNLSYTYSAKCGLSALDNVIEKIPDQLRRAGYT